MLAKLSTENGIMLSGMKRDQTEAKLDSQSLQPADGILIASDLKFMSVLTNLRLYRNNIGDDGAKAIAEALKVNAVLTKLEVGYNHFDEQAALGIVRAARQQDKITFLGLASCGIGAIGAKEIADYIQFTAVLTELELYGNVIGDEGAIAIAEALQSGTSVLTNLNLRFNSIGKDGAEAIVEALKFNRVLTNLHLEFNNMGDAVGKLRDAVTDRIGFKLHL
jgi:Ran GTPase-activating protein (RanGAP) involved in mRNA processing and transport